MNGNSGQNQVSGTNSSDNISGTNSSDILNGMAGDDILDGAAGADTYNGGEGNDRYVLSDTDAIETLHFNNTGTEQDILDISNLLPGSGVNDSNLKQFVKITPNGVFVDPSGSGQFSTENQVARFAAGNPPLNAMVAVQVADTSVIHFDWTQTADIPLIDAEIFTSQGRSNSQSRIAGIHEADNLQGTSGDDALYGSWGDDVLNGGAGADIYSGGAGSDRYVLADTDAVDTLNFQSTQHQQDVLDVSQLLPGGVTAQNLGNYLRVTEEGVYVDAEGEGNFTEGDKIAEFTDNSIFSRDQIIVQLAPEITTSFDVISSAGVQLELGESFESNESLAEKLHKYELSDELQGAEVPHDPNAETGFIRSGEGEKFNLNLQEFDLNEAHGGEGDERLDASSIASLGTQSETDPDHKFRLYGRDGDDTLVGNDDGGFLDGGAGNDRIVSGRGRNLLAGGEGEDEFVLSFEASTDGIRSDNLYDFSSQEGHRDLLDLQGVLPPEANADNIHSYVKVTDEGVFVDLTGRAYFNEENQLARFGEAVDIDNLINLRLSDGSNIQIDRSDALSTVHGDSGSNRIQSGEGSDYLYGNAGDDTLDGDALASSSSADHLFGGEGNDRLFVDELDLTQGTVEGGAGFDEVRISANAGDSVTFDLHGAGVERVRGGDSDDVLDGSGFTDTAGGYNKTTGEYETTEAQRLELYGRDGDDTLLGGVGRDYLDGGSGDDVISGGQGRDFLAGGSGDDVFVLADDNEVDTLWDYQSNTSQHDVIDIDAFVGDDFDYTQLASYFHVDTSYVYFDRTGGGNFTYNEAVAKLGGRSSIDDPVNVRFNGIQVALDPETGGVNVVSINAPTSSDQTVTGLEDSGYTFTASDFSFADLDPGDTLSQVQIDSLPEAGTLTLNGLVITEGTAIAPSDINAGNFRFIPEADATGDGYDSFSFRVGDNAATFSVDANTMTVNITPQNNAPESADTTVSTLEDGALTLTATDFAFSDQDSGDTLTSVVISTLPAEGSLTLDGVAVSENHSISKADIDSGLLTFTPAAHAAGDGYASFGFQVHDGEQYSSEHTVTVDVIAQVDAPLLSSSQAEEITEVFEEVIGTSLGGWSDSGTSYSSWSANNGFYRILNGNGSMTRDIDTTQEGGSFEFTITAKGQFDIVWDGQVINNFNSSSFVTRTITLPDTGNPSTSLVIDNNRWQARIKDTSLVQFSEPVAMDEDSTLALDISAALVDTDGSESLQVELSGVSSGVIISDGDNTVISSGEVIDISGWDQNNLTFQPPQDASGLYSFQVTATSTESNGQQSSRSLPVKIEVNELAELSLVTDGASITESGLPENYIYVINHSGQVAEVNIETGETDVLGSSGVGLWDIALRPDGVLYAVTPSGLYTIDRETAESTLVTSTLGSNSLTFGPDGTLYAMSGTNLISIDTSTGAITTLANVGHYAAGDLSYHNGKLYLAASGRRSDHLVEIDVDNGYAATDLGAIGRTGTYSLSSASDGELYAISGDDILRLNTETGAGTVTAQIGFNIAYGSSSGGEVASSVQGNVLSNDEDPDSSLSVTGVSAGDNTGWIYGIEDTWNGANGELVAFNPVTGETTSIGSTGRYMSDLAQDAGGSLYGITNNSLYLIDKSTGASTVIGEHGVSNIDALTFDNNGTLYGLESSGHLYTLDPSSGQATSVGEIGVVGADYATSDLIFYEGSLYTVGYTSQYDNVLIRIDPENGLETTQVGSGLGLMFIHGLSIGLDGQLYAIRDNELYEIDVSNGTATRVETFSDFEDIEGTAGALDTVDALSQNEQVSGNTGTTVEGQYGSLTIFADGSYNYQLDQSNPDVNALNTGDLLLDTFTYAARDAEGSHTETTLTITVNGTTDVPVIETGTAGVDTLYGRSGDDVLLAEDGADIVFGGAGNDTISGDSGQAVTLNFDNSYLNETAENSSGDAAVTVNVLATVATGVTLSAGTDNGDGTWSLTGSDLPRLTMSGTGNSWDDSISFNATKQTTRDISIGDAGFESRNLVDGGYASGASGNGWTFSGWAGFRDYNSAHMNAVHATEGSDVAYLNNAGSRISQTLTENFDRNAVYELNVDIANRKDFAGFDDYEVRIKAGGVILAADGSVTPGEGEFATLTLTLDGASIAESSSAVGQPITIELVKTSGTSQIGFDNVRLTATTTEQLDQEVVNTDQSDLITGGAGNDFLSGGNDSDTFIWNAEDLGTAENPAEDIITDFSAGSGGDVINLSDVLVDDSEPLENYLSLNFENGDTTIEVRPSGSDVTQKIRLEGVDLSAYGGGSTDAEVLNNLISDGNLQID